jgi:hypothetical protein
MKKQDTNFKIEQLKKDSTYFVLLSIAVTFIIELGYVLLTIITGSYLRLAALIGLLLAVGFFIFALGIGFFNYAKIRKLEKDLSKK